MDVCHSLGDRKIQKGKDMKGIYMDVFFRNESWEDEGKMEIGSISNYIFEFCRKVERTEKGTFFLP